MFPTVEVRHLHAVIVLAEELNFTRAAERLHITQSALSKQINEIEAHHGFHLFIRKNKKECGTYAKWAASSSRRLVRPSCT